MSVPSSTHRLIVAGIVLFALLLFGGLGYFVLYRNWLNAQCEKQFDLAQALVKEGNADQGLVEYRALAERIPGKPLGIRAAREAEWIAPYLTEARALRLQADALLRDGQFEKAIPVYQQVQKQYPLSRAASASREEEAVCRSLICKAALAQARERAARNQWRDVLALARRMLEVDPGYAPGQEAQRDAQAQIDRFEAVMKQAEAAASTGDWAGSRAHCETALEMIPGDPAAFAGRVEALKNIPAPPGMVLILPGSFTVGAEDGAPGEKPVRALDSPGFYMDAAEVTNAQYARFVAATGRKRPPHWGPRGPAPLQENLPVTCVSHHDAAAYAAWVGKRLPNEVEWERAARGRTGRLYPWGNECDGNEAVFSKGPAPAGSAKDRTEEGCLDLGGNVAEWVAFEKEPPPPSDDKIDPLTLPRPLRGGSWAGLETGRPLRVVPERVADKSSDPARTIFSGVPGLFIEIQSPVEEEFFFRGMTNDVAVFEIRKWFPAYGRLVSCSVLIKEGAPISGSRVIPSGPSPSSEGVKVTLDTRCRLVRVLHEGNLRPRVLYSDAAGQEHEMQISDRPEMAAPRPAGAQEIARPGGAVSYSGALRELMAQPLSRAARASSRFTAPGNMLFCNVGFRCAKELP